MHLQQETSTWSVCPGEHIRPIEQSSREMLKGTDLDVNIVPSLVVCCCILHNLVMDAKEVQFKELMCVVALEA